MGRPLNDQGCAESSRAFARAFLTGKILCIEQPLIKRSSKIYQGHMPLFEVVVGTKRDGCLDSSAKSTWAPFKLPGLAAKKVHQAFRVCVSNTTVKRMIDSICFHKDDE
jgi:hypothetical protein